MVIGDQKETHLYLKHRPYQSYNLLLKSNFFFIFFMHPQTILVFLIAALYFLFYFSTADFLSIRLIISNTSELV